MDSETASWKQLSRKNNVLILVLMEDGLGVYTRAATRFTIFCVLILVLMADGLGGMNIVIIVFIAMVS